MSENVIRAYAAMQAGQQLTEYQFNAGELLSHEVEIQVKYCGLCHSDLSIIEDDWHVSQYPVIPGHEVIGQILRLGSQAKGLEVGQWVGLGWTAETCEHCNACLQGERVFCPDLIPTIVGHAGGFADKVRAGWQWVIPLPEQLDPVSAGPLLCGGVTVFHPLLQHKIQAIHRVGVIGIGGLGHIALKLLKSWGCEITAFTSNLNKKDDLIKMGADHVLQTQDYASMQDNHQTFDLILSTVNIDLNWNEFLKLLAPRGAFHFVGAVMTPAQIQPATLIAKAINVTGSDTGTPATLKQLLIFAARHQIQPQVEIFPMSQVNQAITHLKSGKARYRIVLEQDF
ncbi:NAD(P)-dependent alcohol dehydrogenase [Acinetobacter qingfengensis]|uniref:alcohol dehydrogenase (NADP(+)) n=1 Tax=Acinetobacter qingfengensis TaxID=1262585 RepID=A0A1E7R558_9GAMM|nr:NAD(P)-dependent alcohol dehydrogenase [Acinetobacter qingfengensis]KAA8732446.1 NAD(P)-dependent alcohol dehydrogenase [Acinetobacter qingfengensis]OEY94441.1 alcohol dehydrogenase [Acinetobacter qingfengensis]